MKPTVQSGTGVSPKKTPTSTPSKQPVSGTIETVCGGGNGTDENNKENNKDEGITTLSPVEGEKQEGTGTPGSGVGGEGGVSGESAVETARRSIVEGVAGVKASIGKVIPFKQNFGILRLPRLSSLLLGTLC